MNKKVLLTGGAGLIGSNICKSLNDQGITNITIVDRLSKTDKWKNLVGLKFDYFIDADDFVGEFAKWGPSSTMKHWDIIIHMGSDSRTTQMDCSYLSRNNYQFSIDLCRYATNNDIRFIYASSAATYGLGPEMDDSVDLATLYPLNPYGFFKNLFDQYVRNQGWQNKVVGLKYFNIFGPGENHKADMRSVLHKGFEEIRNTGKMTLFEMPTDRKIGRDFLYVKDAAAITTWFALNEIGQKANGLFNIGSGVATSWDELIDYLFKAMDLKPNIKYIPMPEHLKGKYQYFTKADISKLKSIGWIGSETKLEVAVEDYIRNYLVPDNRIGS